MRISAHSLISVLILATCLSACGTTSEDQTFGGGGGDTIDLTQNQDIGPSQNPTAQNFTPQDSSSAGDNQTVVLQPTGILGANPPCSTLAFGDGRGGDLWLPVSEANGLPVYLLNSGWQEPAQVDAQLAGGGFERGNFTGFHNPDADGRDRPHFRFSRSCGSYSGRIVVTDANKSCEVRIPDVCSRID